jgi:putative transposase
MVRVGSCFDIAAAESFFAALEQEVLSRLHFTTQAQAGAVVLDWRHNFYNTQRWQSTAAQIAPAEFEKITADEPAAA